MNYYAKQIERMSLPQACAVKIENRQGSEIVNTHWLNITEECCTELIKFIIAGYGTGLVTRAVGQSIVNAAETFKFSPEEIKRVYEATIRELTGAGKR